MAKHAKTVTAFEYSNESTGAEAPVMFGVIPGSWEPGVPMLASAFAMSDEQLRDAIQEFNLPIVEVEVGESELGQPDRGPNRLLSEQDTRPFPPMPSQEVRMTESGPIPAPPRGTQHPPLQPLAAAMQARDTVLSRGGTIQEAVDAAREAGGDAAEEFARLYEEAATEALDALDTAGQPETSTTGQESDTGAESAGETGEQA